MCDLDGLIRVEHSVLVLMDLAEQGADLHVRFAAVLQHLQLQSWLLRIVKVVAQIVRVKVLNARFEADGALLENAQLLIAHSHVVQSQQEYELVARHLIRLDLVQHCLRFLQQYQGLFILLLRNFKFT